MKMTDVRALAVHIESTLTDEEKTDEEKRLFKIEEFLKTRLD